MQSTNYIVSNHYTQHNHNLAHKPIPPLTSTPLSNLPLQPHPHSGGVTQDTTNNLESQIGVWWDMGGWVDKGVWLQGSEDDGESERDKGEDVGECEGKRRCKGEDEGCDEW